MSQAEASTKAGEIGALVCREGLDSSWLTAWRRELRAQLSHPNEPRPKLLASVPNQVWSWDITNLNGPAEWACDELYATLDVYRRHVVSCLIGERESAKLATKLFERTIAEGRIDRDQLTIHADCGSSITSKDVTFLLADLGITKTHSRTNDSSFPNGSARSRTRSLSVALSSMGTTAITATRASR